MLSTLPAFTPQLIIVAAIVVAVFCAIRWLGNLYKTRRYDAPRNIDIPFVLGLALFLFLLFTYANIVTGGQVAAAFGG